MSDEDEHGNGVRHITPMLACAAAVSLAYAVAAYCHAPASANLYAVVYPAEGPHRPESTATFLFTFPLFLAVGAALGFARRRGWVRRTERRTVFSLDPAGELPFMTIWTALFLIGSLHRSWLVLHSF